MPKATSTDVELRLPSGTELRQMSFDEIGALFEGTAVDSTEVIESDSIGEVLNGNDKDRLLKVPFFILDFRFNEGDMGKFVSARIVTKASEKFVLNDGSSGIYAQLLSASEKGVKGGIACRNGLRKSDYLFCDMCREPLKRGETMCAFHPNEKPKTASTYYIDVK